MKPWSQSTARSAQGLEALDRPPFLLLLSQSPASPGRKWVAALGDWVWQQSLPASGHRLLIKANNLNWAVSAPCSPPLGRQMSGPTMEAVPGFTRTQSEGLPPNCSYRVCSWLSAFIVFLGVGLYALPSRGSTPFKGRACTIACIILGRVA